jgi:exosortase
MQTAKTFPRGKATERHAIDRSFQGFDLARWLLAGTLIACGIALLVPLSSLASWMIRQDYYQHFPLLLIAGIGLAAYRLRKVERIEFQGVLSPRVILWFTVVVVLTATVFALPSRWMASLAGISLLVTALNFYGGPRLVAILLGPLMLFAAAIPLPVKFDNYFVVSLQRLATWMASVWLDLAGILHFTSGVSIDTATQGYFVKDACSGIHSVFAAVAVGVGYGVYRHYRVLRVLAFVAQLLFWVVVANALRVFLTVYGQSRFEWDLSSPAYHEALGMVTFATGVLLAISGDHILRYLFSGRRTAEGLRATDPDYGDRENRILDRPLSPKIVVTLGGIITVLGVGVAGAYFSYSTPTAANVTMEQMAEMAYLDLDSIDASSLPTQIAGWKQTGFRSETRGEDSIFGGMVSHIWQYSNGRRNVLVSVDGPYDDWHDLAVCYSGSGWQIDDMRTISQANIFPLKSGVCYACELRIARPPIDQAEILYICIDPVGNAVKPPDYLGGAVMGVVRRFGIGTQDRSGFRGGVLQLQLMDQTAVSKIGDQQSAENAELFWAATRMIFGDRNRSVLGSVTE